MDHTVMVDIFQQIALVSAYHCTETDLLAGGDEVLREVASEDALLEDARLLQLAPRRPGEDERAQERDQLAVLGAHGLH